MPTVCLGEGTLQEDDECPTYPEHLSTSPNVPCTEGTSKNTSREGKFQFLLALRHVVSAWWVIGRRKDSRRRCRRGFHVMFCWHRYRRCDQPNHDRISTKRQNFFFKVGLTNIMIFGVNGVNYAGFGWTVEDSQLERHATFPSCYGQ